jgi:S1-C subfamily serine protease
MWHTLKTAIPAELALLLLAFVPAAAVAETALSPEQVIDQVSPSVATVLVGDGNGSGVSLGSAVVIRADGVLLTALHVVKDAREVQIKFKSGEVYDNVQLLGVDERRDVAALRVSAGQLPTLTLASLQEVKAGLPVYAVSQARALPWTASSGIASSVRLADEVQGAGNGYRLIQFTAPISPGSSGGLLVDDNARLLGIIVGSFKDGQNLNFAVPVESVVGLADVPATTTFRSGTRLRLPTPAPVLAHPAKAGVDTEGPEKSEVVASRDPKVMLRNFRTLYVKSKTVWLKDEVMKNALRQQPQFKDLGVVLVDDAKLADAVLVTDRVLLTWDFTYSLSHQNTSMILVTGKFTSIDGITAANTIAKDVVRRIQAERMPPGEAKAENKKE